MDTKDAGEPEHGEPPVGSGYALMQRLVAWRKTHAGSALIFVLAIAVYFWVKHDQHPEGNTNIQGYILLSDDKYDEAIASYTEAIRTAPDWYQPYMGRGNAYRLKGDYQRALADLDKSIELRANFPESRIYRGRVLHALGNDTRALADFSEAIRLAPQDSTNGDAYAERAQILRAQGALDSALADYDLAIARNDKTTWLIERAKLKFFELDRIEAAAEDFAAAAHRAISYREFSAMLDTVTIDGKPKKQSPAMMDYKVPFEPGGYYTLLWAHFARVHAGQDDGTEVQKLATELALPIWRKKLLEIDAAMRGKIEDKSRAAALQAWPGPIYLMFLGKNTPEAIASAAQSAADESMRRRRQCDADFYIATFHLQQHADADARPLLQAAAEGCPADSLEAQFAKVAMKRRGS
jgi:tetratricopeptide (TPR) repeat protein